MLYRLSIFFTLILVSKVICIGPDFFILGVQKSGTTSLFNYISQHPNINPPKTKEINFFTVQDKFDKGIQWYLNQFPKPCSGKITGEATPCYIFNVTAQKYIKKHFNKAKFIIIMRNPIYRAFSSFNRYADHNNNSSYGPECKEPRSFEQCIKAYFNKKELTTHKQYISRGLYINHIKEWLKLFPREQFLFLIFEEFIKDPITTTNQVFSFLGLEPYYTLNIKKLNAGSYKDRIISPETEQFLRDFYRPYNQSLEEFLGRSLPWT